MVNTVKTALLQESTCNLLKPIPVLRKRKQPRVAKAAGAK